MTGSFRGVAAAFNAIATVSLAVAAGQTIRGSTDQLVLLWIPAGAAVVGALVVLTGSGSTVGWLALGYILFAGATGLLFRNVASVLVLLYVAFLPLMPRPRGSLVLGLSISIFAAVVLAAYVWTRSHSAS